MRGGVKAWVFLATHPRLYRTVARLGSLALRILGRGNGRIRSLPLAGGWTQFRDMPAPDGPSFLASRTARQRKKP